MKGFLNKKETLYRHFCLILPYPAFFATCHHQPPQLQQLVSCLKIEVKSSYSSAFIQRTLYVPLVTLSYWVAQLNEDTVFSLSKPLRET